MFLYLVRYFYRYLLEDALIITYYLILLNINLSLHSGSQGEWYSSSSVYNTEFLDYMKQSEGFCCLIWNSTTISSFPQPHRGETVFGVHLESLEIPGVEAADLESFGFARRTTRFGRFLDCSR